MTLAIGAEACLKSVMRSRTLSSSSHHFAWVQASIGIERKLDTGHEVAFDCGTDAIGKLHLGLAKPMLCRYRALERLSRERPRYTSGRAARLSRVYRNAAVGSNTLSDSQRWSYMD